MDLVLIIKAVLFIILGVFFLAIFARINAKFTVDELYKKVKKGKD